MLTDSESEFITLVIARNKDMPGALLPILHGIQDLVGFIPAETVGQIASALNLSRAEVHGVITYYHHFRSEPAGRHVVQICRAESCQAMGSDALWQHACSKFGIANGAAHGKGHGTTADGAFTLEPVYCLGLCASSPAMAVDEKVHARVGIDKFDRVVARTAAAEGSPA